MTAVFLNNNPSLSPSPIQYPSTCGTAAVTSVCDITVGYDSTRPPHYKPVSVTCQTGFTSIIIAASITSITNRYYRLILVVR